MGEGRWRAEIDTDPAETRDVLLAEKESVELAPWSMLVLRHETGDDTTFDDRIGRS